VPHDHSQKENYLTPSSSFASAYSRQNDHYLDGERMKTSSRFAKVSWRYQIEGASHWIPLDAPNRLNQLLFEWMEK
jgi:pimeloyl-ACP methyl ester carboxylesterase